MTLQVREWGSKKLSTLPEVRLLVQGIRIVTQVSLLPKPTLSPLNSDRLILL